MNILVKINVDPNVNGGKVFITLPIFMRDTIYFNSLERHYKFTTALLIGEKKSVICPKEKIEERKLQSQNRLA